MDKYQEALERAKKGLPIDEVFPELKESEDERILEWIIGIVNSCKELSFDDKVKLTKYLEKQKERKPAESTALHKAFISSKIDYALEEKCDASDYADAILPTSVACGENDEEYKLHKIIEAAFIAGQKKERKSIPGVFTFDDVLALESAMALAKGDEKLHGALTSLFERVHDAYHGEPKPAEWSEEDKKMLLSAIEYVQTYPAHRQSVVTWLKFLPERFNLQSHWKPSEEQMEVDLDKEYAEFIEADPVYSKLVNGIVGKAIARHFYELSKARKEK